MLYSLRGEALRPPARGGLTERLWRPCPTPEGPGRASDPDDRRRLPWPAPEVDAAGEAAMGGRGSTATEAVLDNTTRR
jgi:hypothetical protein